jgi:hypothetical protein
MGSIIGHESGSIIRLKSVNLALPGFRSGYRKERDWSLDNRHLNQFIHVYL